MTSGGSRARALVRSTIRALPGNGCRDVHCQNDADLTTSAYAKIDLRVATAGCTVGIPLSRGGVALIDEADAHLVAGRRWFATSCRRTSYAGTRIETAPGKFTTLLLHRLILGCAPGQIVDHRNGDGLDCRRANLRLCSGLENSRNRRHSKSARLPFKGIHQIKARFQAVIVVTGKACNLGRFDTPEAAARAYDAAAREHFGEFACLNFPMPGERSALTTLVHVLASPHQVAPLALGFDGEKHGADQGSVAVQKRTPAPSLPA